MWHCKTICDRKLIHLIISVNEENRDREVITEDKMNKATLIIDKNDKFYKKLKAIFEF